MKIEFLGGARTVTGSCYILNVDNFRIMVDCGMFQGRRDIRERNLLNRVYKPGEIDVILLTHAHIDHSGLIPKLVKRGFNGKIYSTFATADLCEIMLPDSAHIQEMDVKWVNRKNRKLGRKEVEPLYSIEDAKKTVEYFTPVKYGETIKIKSNIEVRFRDAGHILGSSFIEIWVEKNGNKSKIVFSGDLGPDKQAIIRDPEPLEDADFLLIESTYGDRLHKNKEETYSEFKEIILESSNNEGNIIIPAFAIERTQEIIYSLAKLFKSDEIPLMPVYIDSPLAISATEIFRKNKQCFDEETRKILLSGDSPLDFKNLHFTRSSKESKRLNDEAKGSIIISASGMCTAGRIKYHLQNNLYKKNSSVIFVGYQAEGTLGRRIIDGANQVRVYGEDVAVNAKIHTLGGFSAHADRNDLYQWIKTVKNPNMKIFVIHGEEKTSMKFSEDISSELGYNTYVPRWGEIVDLEKMAFDFLPYAATESYTDIDKELELFSKSLNLLTDRYKKAKEDKFMPDVDRLKDDISDVREMLEGIIDEN